MPSMTEHPSATAAKMLLVGDSGAGKSGGLASLVDAGYRLFILDFDAGLDPLAGYVKKKERLANVQYETLKDEFKLVAQSLVIKKAPSFQRAMALLENWGDFGPVQSWGSDTILVIDTLGSMSRASFNMVLQANGVTGSQGTRGGPEQAHWGTAMENVERVLDNLAHPGLVPCHLIVNAHWTWQEDKGGMSRAYPEAIGNKLNPKIARRFNNMLSLSVTGGKRSFKTKKDGMIALKTSKPMSREEYPIDTGLADIFKELVGPPPSAG